MRAKKSPQFISYQRLIDTPTHIARKSLQFDLPVAMSFDEIFETYRWKVFFNTPRNKTKIYSE